MLQFMTLCIIWLASLSQFTGWDLLATTDVITEYDEFIQAETEKPRFSSQLESADGKSIVLEGFIIPISKERESDYFVLSRFPYQSCFFCGAAGPETVVEVYSRDVISFTDDQVKVEGTLTLNRSNPMQLFFLIKDARVTEP